MTKNLSEQLCELCGIEPIKEPSRTYDSEGNVEYDVKYVDFEEPENFVKLFNLKVKFIFPFKSITEYLNPKWGGCNTKEYLRFLVHVLSINETPKPIKEAIKQAIRDEKWKWE